MNKLKVLFTLFFVPICAGIFYNNAPVLQENSLKEAIYKGIDKSTDIDDTQKREEKTWIRSADFKAVCAGNSVEYEVLKARALSEFCTALPRYQFLETAGIVCLGFGAAFMLVLFTMGRLASRSRDQLMFYFKLGWLLARPASLLMVLAQGVLAFFLIFDLSAILLNRIFIQILGAIAIAGIALLYQLTRIFLKPLVLPDLTLDGVQLTPGQAPLLWSNVKKLAERVGTQPPDQIILGHHPSFFVTEFPVRVSQRALGGRTLVMSLPILERYSHSEASAVIAHELAHFYGSDTKITQQFYPIYRGSALAVQQTLASGAIGIPAFHLLNYFMGCFGPVEAKFGRDRELEADRIATTITSNAALAAALYKIHLFAEAWERAELKVAMEKAAFSVAFVEAVSSLPKDTELKSHLERRTINHPMDTHPPLAVRLEALGFKISDFDASKILKEESISEKIVDDSIAGETKFKLETEYQQKMVAVHEKLKVKTATGDSPEERELLEKMFPPFGFKSGKLGYFMVVLCGGLGALFGFAGLATGTKSDFGLAAVFVMIALPCFWGCYYYLKIDLKRSYQLFHDRIESNQWQKPLYFRDITEISAQSVNGSYRAFLKISSPAVFPYTRPGYLSWLSKKAVVLVISGLDQKPDFILEKLYRYYLREPGAQ